MAEPNELDPPNTMDGHSERTLAQLEQEAVDLEGGEREPDDQRFEDPGALTGFQDGKEVEAKGDVPVESRTTADWEKIIADKDESNERVKVDLYRSRERVRTAEGRADQIMRDAPRPVKSITLGEGLGEVDEDGKVTIDSNHLEKALEDAGIAARQAVAPAAPDPVASYDGMKNTYLAALPEADRDRGRTAIADLEGAYAFIDSELGAELTAQGRRPDSIKSTGELVTLFEQSGISSRYQAKYGDMGIPIESILMGATNPDLFGTVVSRYMAAAPLQGEETLDRRATLRQRPRAMASRGAGGPGVSRLTAKSIGNMTPDETFQATRSDLQEMEEIARNLKE